MLSCSRVLEAQHARGLSLRLLAALVAAALSLGPDPALGQPTIANWDRWEQTLTTTRDYHLGTGNPYRDLVLRVTYTPTNCSGSPWCTAFTSYGFWDGGRTFKIRSAFPGGFPTATWSWQVACSGVANGFDCSTDPALDSVLGGGQTTTSATGNVSVYLAVPLFDTTNPYLYQIPYRGFLRISSDNRHLTYGNGVTKFFWSGDTAWEPAAVDINSNTRWLQFLNDRAQRGFTVVMTAPAPKGDDPTFATQTLFEDLGAPCLGDTWPKSCSRWRPGYWQKLDEKIKLANARGLLVVLIGVMDPLGNGPTPKYPRPQDAAVFARNLAARLAGSFVLYSPSFDDPLGSTANLMDWVGCALREAAPRHLVTGHLAGGSNVADYQTLHNRRWHQLQVFQSGHAQNTTFANPWEDPFEYAVRRAREVPLTLYNTTASGTPPGCPNVPAITLPPPATRKPNVNAEAAYDSTYSSPTYTQLNSQLVDTPQGVRHTGYNSTLNGAFGFTLGVKGIWDWTNISSTTLASEGSRHMDILSDQFRLQPWQSLQWRSSLIKNQRTETYNGQQKPEEDKQVVMAVTSDNGFAMIYIPDNAEVKIDARTLTGFDCSTSAWSKTWVNPRDGQPAAGGSCENISEPSGATRKLKRPTCLDQLNGDSGKCDWLVKLQRTSSGTTAGSLASELEVWPEPAEDGKGWRIAGQVVSRTSGPQSAPQPAAVSEAKEERGLLKQPVVAREAQGGFFVVWEAENDGYFHGIFSQRMTAQGLRLGSEQPVNLTTEGDQIHPWVAAGPAGGGVVTWTSLGQDGDSGGVFARRIDGSGTLVDPEIQVNQFTAGRQDFSRVGMDAQGRFVVAWTSEGQDGDLEGVYMRRFDGYGNPLGPEILVNPTTAGAQFLTDLEVSPLGDFTVTWTSYSPDEKEASVLARKYDTNGVPLGAEFVLAEAPPLEQASEPPAE